MLVVVVLLNGKNQVLNLVLDRRLDLGTKGLTHSKAWESLQSMHGCWLYGMLST